MVTRHWFLLVVLVGSLAMAGCGSSETDEDVPVLTVDQLPADAVADASVLLAGTIEPGADLEVTVDTEAVVESTAVSAGEWMATIGSLQEGFNTVSLKAIDSAGNIHLIRIAVERDTTAPSVLTIAPSGTAAAAGSVVTVTFSEPVQAPTLPGNFLLLDAAANPVPGVLAPAEGMGAVATFDPAADLTPGQSYTVWLSSGIRDQMNLPLLLQDEQGQVVAEKTWVLIWP